MRRRPKWGRCVSLTVNSKNHAFPELCPQHSVFPTGTESSLRYSQGSAQNTVEERPIGNSLCGRLQTKQTTMAPLHSTAQLRLGSQPRPQVLSLRELDLRGIFAVATPCPGWKANRSACCRQAQDLASSLSCFSPETSSRTCLRIGARRLSYSSRFGRACDSSSFLRISWSSEFRSHTLRCRSMA